MSFKKLNGNSATPRDAAGSCRTHSGRKQHDIPAPEISPDAYDGDAESAGQFIKEFKGVESMPDMRGDCHSAPPASGPVTCLYRGLTTLKGAL